MNMHLTAKFLSVALLVMIISCNQDDKKEIVKQQPSVDTLQKSIPAESPDTTEEDPDFTKHNINLTQEEWAAFRKKYQVREQLQTASSITGNFLGNGVQQTLYIVPPAEDTIHKNAFEECIGGCNSYIVSTDSSINILKVTGNLGGDIKNIGDIDGDGADEIMVYPDWWQSNWNPYVIYSYNIPLHKWSFLTEPVSIFANELEKKMTL
ncbi:MAG: hypothetical protein ABJA78_16590 [Ferruginibacter sp.]